MIALHVIIGLFALLCVTTAQERPPAVVAAFDRDQLPAGAHAMLEDLNTRNADLRDVLRAIARQHDINLWVDDRIETSVTVRLAGVPVLEALLFLCEQHGLALEQSGGILRVAILEPPASPLEVRVVDGRLFLDLRDAPIEATARALAEAGETPIVVRQGVAGVLSGYLQDVPFEVGLHALLDSNGFVLRQADGIWQVDRRGRSATEAGEDSGAWIEERNGAIDLDLRDTGIAEALQAVADRMGFDLVVYALPEGRITVRASGLTVEQALNYLLRNTSLTYRQEGGVIIVGDRQLSGIASTRLLPLRHIQPEGIAERMPDAIRRAAAFQTVEEQNALLVTAPVNWQIDYVVVRPDVRGSGVAGALVKAALNEAFRTNVPYVMLTSRESLRPLYEGCGFTPIESNRPRTFSAWAGDGETHPVPLPGQAATAN